MNIMEKPLTIFLIGRSGCGKGTQADLLVNFLKQKNGNNILYVYAGNKMRELIQSKENLTSVLAKEIMFSGKKQPNFLAVWAWANELVENLTQDKNIILDGSPRDYVEAKILDEAMEFYDRFDIKPVLIDVSYDWARERLLARKRFDDTEERICNRLRYFDKFVQSAIDYYQSESAHKLIKVNGEQSIEDVHHEIVKALGLA